ncbi:MAG: TRAP transporter substrate-binding protein DctP [Gammaproteobacteria bacterium]|jgi:TRAP-type C4-dicarboxylate transport system substrate-binding protein|nr:TRAP transporter substrate-binding protein DctP [Gammaproteobacteria bacterium]
MIISSARHLSSALVTTLVLLVLGAPAAFATDFKIATIAPEGTAWMKQMRDGSKEIKTRTDGRVNFKFYGGGVMGNDKKVLRKIRIGQLHGGMFTPSSMADVYPDMQLYGMPLVFNSLAEVEYVRQRMDGILKQGLEDAGFVSFGWADGGFAMIMSNIPVTGVDSLQGRKVWVPEGDLITYSAMAALGLSPVTLPITDVMTGLQTGLIDIVGSSPVGAVVMQWHTKVKYITDIPLIYLMGFMVVDKKYFDKLSEPDQQVVREVFSKVYQDFDRQNKLDDSEAFKALISSGMQIVHPDESEVESWRKPVEASNRDLAERGVISKKMLDQMLAYIAEYRSQHQGTK